MNCAVQAPSTTPMPPRLRDGVAFCVGVFLAARVVLAVVGVLGVGVLPVDPDANLYSARAGRPIDPGWHNAIDGTDRWDAGWLLRISREGYDTGDASAAFFPAYPFAVRAVADVTGASSIVTGILVSNAAFLGALVVLHALTSLEFSPKVARRTVVIAAFFPTSFFFLAPYSESLFLLAALVSFWAARRGRWLVAGLAGAVAAATRIVGIVLLPALLVEAFFGERGAERRTRWRRAGCAGLVALGPALYSLGWWLAGSRPLQPLKAQGLWDRMPAFPLATLGKGLLLAVRGLSVLRGAYWTADFAFAFLALALLTVAIVRRWLRPSYLTYAALSLLVPLCDPAPSRPLLSFPRFTIVVFPLFWTIALLLPSPRKMAVATALSGLAYVGISLLFVNWGYLF
jgi:mannosyltransferase PIG-V